MTKRQTGWIALAGLLLLAACGEHTELPTEITTGESDFGANDTSFVLVRPTWTADIFGWDRPGDIQVGRSGFLYVVDGAMGGRVVQLQTNGAVVKDDIFTSVTDTSAPVRGIGQDSRLNLFAVNGTNAVFAWNEYVALHGVQGVAQRVTVRETETGDEHELDSSRPLWRQLEDLELSSRVVEVVDATISEDADTLDAFSGEYLFHLDNRHLGDGAPLSNRSVFTDVDGGPMRYGNALLTDEANDRLLRLEVQPTRVLLLGNGEYFYQFEGVFAEDVITAGEGQASARNPTGLATSGTSALPVVTFVQSGGNFLVQRLKWTGYQWGFDFSGDTKVLELEYFGDPMAVAVGEQDNVGLGLFYVADSTQDRVTAFHPGGEFFREVGAKDTLVDLEGGDSLSTRLAELGIVFREAVNSSLVDFVAAVQRDLLVQEDETIPTAALREGLDFQAALNPELDLEWTAPADTLIPVAVPHDTTVKVNIPIVESPTGVATREGVVYVSDTGNNRLLRYRRTDNDVYLPENPDFP